ncbi:MAG: hypothetical protein ACREPS_02890 [Rhodanobacteraceae bacterium]
MAEHPSAAAASAAVQAAPLTEEIAVVTAVPVPSRWLAASAAGMVAVVAHFFEATGMMSMHGHEEMMVHAHIEGVPLLEFIHKIYLNNIFMQVPSGKFSPVPVAITYIRNTP